MQSTLKLKHAVMLLIALNCVLLCTAQGGWGGDSGAPGAPGGGNGGGAPGAPGAPGGGSGAPGAPGGNHHVHSYASAGSGFAQLQWLLALMPFTFILKYV
ncbi:PREDICTED: translation initiation factor IF-2-like [Rhagoletis zephyria]|uniref:translation initiation factor IF-2-like n=1 Tax=Rhagoletis zephyria TaxID=28612 RepID=UPI0008112F45|nr:PREDICTED: translation initiation factor IF-2-like [Rhagoletis zephyria]XP_036322605.1 translation initiation factor IF-2-like [Rhagoletis pomonella]